MNVQGAEEVVETANRAISIFFDNNKFSVCFYILSKILFSLIL